MKNNKKIKLAAFLLIFAFSAYSNESYLPKDTIIYSGKTQRIIGYCLLGCALAYSGFGAYGYYKSKHDPNLTDYRTILDEYPILLAAGLGCGIGSGIMLKIGYNKKHEYEKWKNGKEGSVSFLVEFNLK